MRQYKKIKQSFKYSTNSIYHGVYSFTFPNGYTISVVKTSNDQTPKYLKNLLYNKICESNLITGFEKHNKKHNKKGKKYKNSGKLKGKTNENFNPAVLNSITNRQICSL